MFGEAEGFRDEVGLQGVVVDDAAGADPAVLGGSGTCLYDWGDLADYAAKVALLFGFANLVGQNGAFVEFWLWLAASCQPNGLDRAVGRRELSLQNGGISSLCILEVEFRFCNGLRYLGIDIHAEFLQFLALRLIGHFKTVVELNLLS